MIGHQKKDDTTKQPRFMADGTTPMMEFYYAVAIEKVSSQNNGMLDTDWRQTPWGNDILNAAVEGWPNGEHMQATFAWKIVDGDSPVPNKNQSIPNQQEGFPGHWIIQVRSGFATASFHAGRYLPEQVIQNSNEIKRGDYVRVQVSVKGNSPSKSAGIYINPMMFELSRAGVQIMSANAPDASNVFGGAPAQLPQNGQFDQSVQQGGYQPPQQGGQPQGGYQPPQQGGQPQGGYQPPQQGGQPQGGYQPPQQGGGQQPVQQPVQGYQQADQNFLNGG
jgi:hypothetical protein